MHILAFVCETVLVGLLIWGACLDVLTYRLPNWLTLATAVTALVFVSVSAGELSQIAWHAGFGIACLAVGLVLFRFGLLGGGDVKWLAALAIWIGPSPDFLKFLLIMGICGGLLACLMLLATRFRPSYGRQNGRLHLPYGVAIAVAGLEYWARHGVIADSLHALL